MNQEGFGEAEALGFPFPESADILVSSPAFLIAALGDSEGVPVSSLLKRTLNPL